MKRNFLLLSFLMLSAAALAQQPNLNNSTKPKADTTDIPLDGYYKKSNLLNAKVTPYANLREADVMFVKRVWREIDLREKMNKIYGSPKARLVDVIMNAVMAGELTAYDVVTPKGDPDDKFSSKLKPAQVMAKFADSVLVPILDSLTGDQTGTLLKPGIYNADSVIKFRIKEDWIFDKQRSVWEPRIIGIAPMVKIRLGGGQTFDDQPAFWVYFPEARHIFVTKEAINRGNDATGLSYDDIFMKRLFDSYIVKESNPDDLRIKDYPDVKDGMDRLIEAERVKKKLFDYEHDLWSY